MKPNSSIFLSFFLLFSILPIERIVFQEWVTITDLDASELPYLGPDLVLNVVAWMAMTWADKELMVGGLPV